MFGKDYTGKVRDIYEAFNSRDFDKAVSFFPSDFEMHNMATGETFRGPDGMKRFMQGWATGFPDCKVEITNLVDGDDWVICEFHGKGHHTGTFTGPFGSIPATGKEIDVPFCDVWQFKDGKPYRGRAYFDGATFMRMLGMMPERPTEHLPETEHMPDTEHYTQP